MPTLVFSFTPGLSPVQRLMIYETEIVLTRFLLGFCNGAPRFKSGKNEGTLCASSRAGESVKRSPLRTGLSR
jgi:hypothetical protein